MFQKNSMLVDVATGEKMYCLAIRKTGAVVAAYSDNYDHAKSQLINDATNNPDAVRGGIIKYIPKGQRLDLDPSRLITLSMYEKAMNNSECKAIRQKIDTLKSEVEQLQSSLKAKNLEIREAYKQSVQILMNPNKKAEEAEEKPKPKPKLIKK